MLVGPGRGLCFLPLEVWDMSMRLSTIVFNSSFVMIAGLVSVTLLGCSSNPLNKMQNVMDSMRDDTGIMAANTSLMGNNTVRMAESTREMSQMTAGMSENTTKMAASTAEMSRMTERLALATEGMSESTRKMAEATDKMQRHMGIMSQAMMPLVTVEEKLDRDLHPEKLIKQKLENVSSRLERIKNEVDEFFKRPGGANIK
jgi:chromosome segregation ATPase